MLTKFDGLIGTHLLNFENITNKHNLDVAARGDHHPVEFINVKSRALLKCSTVLTVEH